MYYLFVTSYNDNVPTSLTRARCISATSTAPHKHLQLNRVSVAFTAQLAFSVLS